jgi:hypothetical protein
VCSWLARRMCWIVVRLVVNSRTVCYWVLYGSA